MERAQYVYEIQASVKHTDTLSCVILIHPLVESRSVLSVLTGTAFPVSQAEDFHITCHLILLTEDNWD